ncbi:MAG TPA: hypothetical protein VIH61_10190 [Waddliaceae bacterium]
MRKILLLIILSIHFTINGSEVGGILKTLTYNEHFYLNKFFHACVCSDHFGFTIFFDKPVALSSYFIRCRSDELASPYRNKQIALGWKVWKKHEHLFPHENFIFCEEQENVYDENLNFTFKTCHIYLINKAALLSLLRAHKITFSRYLGEEFSPEGFLAKVENTKTLMPHLNNSEALLGIVLGYGLEAALQFERMRDCSIPCGETHYQSICSYQPKECSITPVVFAGNPGSAEAQSIQNHYSEQIEKIWQIYKDKDFLQIVLNTLCSKNYLFGLNTSCFEQ